MRKLLVLAVSAAAVFSTCQAQAAHRHRRLVKVRTESRPPEGPLWYYSRPTPLGATATTVSDLPRLGTHRSLPGWM